MDYESWPMISDDDDDVHPVAQALQKQDSKIDGVEIVGNWRDDHADCLAAIIEIDGVKHEMSDWWLSREGLKMWIRAEAGVRSALDQLKDHLLSLS